MHAVEIVKLIAVGEELSWRHPHLSHSNMISSQVGNDPSAAFHINCRAVQQQGKVIWRNLEDLRICRVCYSPL